jgi:hypothetical protein
MDLFRSFLKDLEAENRDKLREMRIEEDKKMMF